MRRLYECKKFPNAYIFTDDGERYGLVNPVPFRYLEWDKDFIHGGIPARCVPYVARTMQLVPDYVAKKYGCEGRDPLEKN